MTIINTLAFFAFAFLFIRIILLIRIDSYQSKNTFLKFLFGGYAFQAMIPTQRKPNSVKEASLIKASNICLVFFYVLFITILLIVVFWYDDLTKPVPKDNNTHLAMLNIKTKKFAFAIGNVFPSLFSTRVSLLKPCADADSGCVRSISYISNLCR
jgi:hypothetical protein